MSYSNFYRYRFPPVSSLSSCSSLRYFTDLSFVCIYSISRPFSLSNYSFIFFSFFYLIKFSAYCSWSYDYSYISRYIFSSSRSSSASSLLSFTSAFLLPLYSRFLINSLSSLSSLSSITWRLFANALHFVQLHVHIFLRCKIHLQTKLFSPFIDKRLFFVFVWAIFEYFLLYFLWSFPVLLF